MKILLIELKDTSTGWTLEKTEFDSLTLLVGASGVGKTRILRVIQWLVDVAEGKWFNGLSWRLEFYSNKGNHYIWSGEFEGVMTVCKPTLVSEKIYEGDKLLVDRNPQKTWFDGKDIAVKLAADKSGPQNEFCVCYGKPVKTG